MADYTPTLIPLPATATPESYRSAEAIKAQREYAKALLYGRGQQPVQHWTQGVSNMVSALMGGQADYAATQRENASNDITGNSMTVPLAGGAAPKSFTDAQSDEGGTKTADAGDMSDMAARKAAVATIESGSPEGNYHAIGPVVQKGAYAGDRAYGKYQVMGKNLPVWSKEIFGRVMTPQEFMDNPKAQEKMFEVKSTSNPRDWFGHGFSDGKTTGTEYERRYAEGLRKYGGGGTQPAQTATAFAGAPAEVPAEAPGPAAITAAALRGGNAGPGMRQQAIPIGGQAPIIDPATVPRPPKIPYEQMRAIMSNPRIPWEQKMQMQSMYFQQQQPITVPVPGGTVVVSPDDPRVQRANPEVHWGSKKLPGGLEYQVPSTVFGSDPSGRVIQNPAVQAPVGPRSDAGGSVTPSAAPQGGPEPTPASVQAAAQSVPLPTPRPPGANAADIAEAPVQVASLDPTAGVAKTGEGPSMPAAAPSEDIAPVVPAGETKVAQALNPALGNSSEPPPGYTRDDWESVRRYKQFENDAAIQQKEREATIEVGKKNEEKQIETGWKAYEQNRENSRSARDLLPNIETAQNLLNDPRMHTGILSGGQDFWSRIKESFGEKAANAPNELFDKSAAAAVLGALKPALQGTGQVRLMEVQLLQKANASRFYGDAANRAVLEISRRAMSKLAAIGDMADQYVLGQDVTTPDGKTVLLKAGQGKRYGLDAGFNQIASGWVKQQNEKDLAYYKDTESLFTTGKAPDGQKLWERDADDSKVPSNPVIGQPWTFHDEEGKTMQGVFNGKDWVPKDQYQPPPTAPPVSK